MTSFASPVGMLLATAQGAVSARMASVLPRRVCFLTLVFVFDAEGAAYEQFHPTLQLPPSWTNNTLTPTVKE